MRIGELADATGVSPRALRYYEQEGLLSADRTANGYRRYDVGAVTVVRNIRRLLDIGLTVRDIRRLAPCLQEDSAPEPGCDDAIDVYRRRLTVLDQRRALLDEVRARLAEQLTEVTVR